MVLQKQGHGKLNNRSQNDDYNIEANRDSSHTKMSEKRELFTLKFVPVPVRLLGLMALLSLGLLFLTLSFTYTDPAANSPNQTKYLYWGYRIDCPGKHCDTCAGLGHQESSLRCALEEAIDLGRTFVLPSQMCLNQQHNDKGLLHKSGKFEGWDVQGCSMDSLYDLNLMSRTVRVILDSSAEWQQALSDAHHSKRHVDVTGVKRSTLKNDPFYKDALLINRTASPLAWFVECEDRKNRSAVLLPYSFLPNMAAKHLRQAAQKIIAQLGDYDAIHVRRGDKLKIRKDRFGVNRTLFPHLDRDTQGPAIVKRIAKWVPEGRTLFIASNERKAGFFDALKSKYKVVFSSEFSSILNPVVENNYQLFMIERLILYGAKTYVKTFRESPSDLSLTDDVKKKLRAWQIPVYTFDESPSPL